jgi:hypothetical protein
MPSILIVEKSGTIKSINVKNASIDELYKKAGFKTNTDFELHTTWNVDLHGKHYCISLYGKKNGRANQENKYEFPPPVDSVLYFGNCVLVSHNNEICVDLSVSDWEKIYDHLYGGFEDLDNSSEDSSSDDMDVMPKTKSGYVKDDFVVDDHDESEYEEDNSNESESDIPPPPAKSSRSKKNTHTSSNKKNDTVNIQVQEPVEYLGCTSELSEEEYV